MNQQLRIHADNIMLEGLRKLNADCHKMFKLMYGRKGGKRPVEESVAMSIEDVVKEVPDKMIDTAIDQIQRSTQKPQLLATP